MTSKTFMQKIGLSLAFKLSIVAGLAVLLSAVSPNSAQAVETYIVVDVETGRILDQKRPLRPWYPASVTKLMTTYVTLQHVKSGRIDMRSPVTVSQNALNQPPSKMGFKVGTVLTVENALKMILVKSANDISVALGEAVSGSEPAFIARMNETARRLGMTGTNFKNPHGLPAKGQVTNARDMAVLTRAIIKEFPEYGYLFKLTAIRAGKRVLPSYNTLLQHYRGATGMKTGFICSSGYNLVGTAERRGKHVIAVVFGAKSSVERGEKAGQLLNKGFRGLRLGGRKTVDDVVAQGLGREPKDMRPEICSAQARQERVKTIRAYKIGEGRSVLSKHKLISAAPDRVFTGGAIAQVAFAFRNAPPPKTRPDVDLSALEIPAEVGDGDGISLGYSEDAVTDFKVGGYPVPIVRPNEISVTEPVAADANPS